MWKDKAVHILLAGFASTSILVVLLIFLFLGREAAPFTLAPGLMELFDSRWIPVSFQQERFGILSLVSGSALVTCLAMVITIPLSVIGAVYIAEIAHPTEREALKPFIEILASIPSVVLGFFGLLVLAPLVKELFGLNTGLNALTGAILLALMAIPTVITISEDAINSVPESYKAASMALGASRLQTIWKVTVPAALPGIIAAIMLGTGRVIGETMAVLMVTGNSAVISFSPLSSVRTMTATIAAEMGEVPFGSVHYQALFCIGVVLLLVTFSLNVLAQRVLKKYGMMQ
ncbi:MAG: phosphate ABC transporter permease subunit PstC [Proteobacteria bacterium]|nr:phosphate ABC transporter permease subunit PstC [Pseudomonadota bacterium]MBU1709162.1 phosphate ABC transporter permease subunit PstC [Pseudomonadota bacterium]